MNMPETMNARPPRDGLVRAQAPGTELELREVQNDDGSEAPPTLTGHFAVFDQWTEINSMFEGNFMERFQPGAFSKTISEGREGMRALFQHGHDPVVGDKPLGPIDVLEEDEVGARYEVPLLDTSYVRDLIPGLEQGLYGASFRFRVTREDINDEAEESDHNPKGLDERTVKEAQVMEFGPVTFPAYKGASAGLRSLTDEFIVAVFAREPERCRAMFAAADAELATSSPELSERRSESTNTTRRTAPGRSSTPTTGPIRRPPRREQGSWLRPPPPSRS